MHYYLKRLVANTIPSGMSEVFTWVCVRLAIGYVRSRYLLLKKKYIYIC